MILEKVKNPWAAANDPTGSGFVDCALELYLCPRCGAHPSMVDNAYGEVGLLCMKCGFGRRPIRGSVKAFDRWNSLVEEYAEWRHEYDDWCEMRGEVREP